MTTALTLLSLLIWLYLALFHHGFWRRREFLPEIDQNIDWPEVTSLTPARNEEAVISHSLSSLLLQNYAGAYKTILINDSSDDDTLSLAQSAMKGSPSATILEAPPLGKGWSGKLWALHNGFKSIPKDERPDYYWLSAVSYTHLTLPTICSV